MDGRPVQEVLPALNQQIAAQLAQRGLPEDWLKIELSPDSNPKARIDAQPETPGSLRSVLSMLGDPIIDRGPFGVNRGRYRYVLPSAIQLLKKASLYREDKEPLSLHDDAFAGQAVRATLTRYPGRDDAPETFRVEWLCDLHPELPRVSEALDLIHRTLPHEAAAGSVTCIDIQRAGASWRRCARATAVTRFIRYPILISDPPLTLIGKRPFLITLDDKTINEASKWNFTGNPPLELKAAIRVALAALRKTPGAEAQWRLERITLAPLDPDRGLADPVTGQRWISFHSPPVDPNHTAYQIIFSDPTENTGNHVTIPVLLSGKAITPKPQPTSTKSE